MTEVPASLLEAALKLPQGVRVELADRLYESVDAPADGPVELHPDWADEIRQRLDDMDSGRETPLSVEEAWKVILDDSDAREAH